MISQMMPFGNIIPARFDNYTTHKNEEPLMLKQLVYIWLADALVKC
jgi:hypothetical protein